jgi:hypothetical protein
MSLLRLSWLGPAIYCMSSFLGGCGRHDAVELTEAPLRFSSSNIDLGSFDEGEEKFKVVRIENTSDRKIRITEAKASCGCTSLEVAPRLLAPKGTAELKMKISSQGWHGEFGSHIKVSWTEEGKTNRGETAKVVSVRGNGLFWIDVTPRSLDFGSFPLSRGPEPIVLEVRKGTQGEFDKVRLEGTDGRIHATPLSEGGGVSRFRLALSPDSLPSGPFRDVLDIVLYSSSGKEVARKSMLVRGLAEGNVTASPKTILIGTLSEGVQKVGTIRLEARDNQPIRVSAMRAEPAGSPVTLKLAEGNTRPGALEIEYYVNAAGARGNRSGHLVFELYGEQPQILNVPFILFVDKKSERSEIGTFSNKK